jgi:NAD(P)-dependent dehydrogenase (short-subunit alcohol dehydrogenase family)
MTSTSTAVVTGAGGGIGAACAAELADRGWHVVVADLDLAAAQRTVDTIVADGGTAEPVRVDMADPASVRALIDGAAAGPGGLGALVNNAGIAIAKPITEYTVEQWDLQLAVNLRGPFLAIQAAVPHFVARGGGKVVNIASTAAFVSSSTPESAYDVSKAGVRQLTVSASVELAPLGINVNAVAPGTIATPLTTAVLDTDDKMANAGSKIPAGRIGVPSDIAKAVAFLASSDADYVHAHTLVVDGGWLAL